jgi:hypothetical protein
VASETKKAGWDLLPAEYHDRAAELLAACPQLGSVDAGLAAINDVRGSEGGEVYAWVDGDDLIAVYAKRASATAWSGWLLRQPGRGSATAAPH